MRLAAGAALKRRAEPSGDARKVGYLMHSCSPAPTLQKGAAATEAWTEARKRTTSAGLGGMVYAKLLKYGPEGGSGSRGYHCLAFSCHSVCDSLYAWFARSAGLSPMCSPLPIFCALNDPSTWANPWENSHNATNIYMRAYADPTAMLTPKQPNR